MSTLRRVASQERHTLSGVRLGTIEALCDYFELLSVAELIEVKR